MLTGTPRAASIFPTKLIHFSRAVLMLLSLALAVVSCSQKSGPSLVGKWSRGNDLIFTFTKDGDMIRQEGAGSETMGYSLSGTNLYVKPKDLPISLTYGISFPSTNELVLSLQPASGTATSQQDTEPIRLSRVE